MKRAIAVLTVSFSVLLSVCMCALIIRTFCATDMVEHFNSGPRSSIRLQRSRVRLVLGRGAAFVLHLDELEVDADPAEHSRHIPDFIFKPFWSHDIFAADPANSVDHSWCGFGYERSTMTAAAGWSAPQQWAIRFPLWPLLLLTISPAAGYFVLRLRKANPRRAKPERSPECGSDSPIAFVVAA